MAYDKKSHQAYLSAKDLAERLHVIYTLETWSDGGQDVRYHKEEARKLLAELTERMRA